jgi:spore maturation protein CgeB
VHHPVGREADRAASLTYVAHRRADRDAIVQRGFFDAAAALPARRFVLAGCGWESAAMPSNVDYVGYVYTSEHNAYYASATAALSLSAPAAARFGYCPSASLFEAAGADTCVISSVWTGIDAFLEPGREIVVTRDAGDVVEQLAELGPERAATIGRRAGRRSRFEHTYERRAAELEALLEGLDGQWLSRTAL